MRYENTPTLFDWPLESSAGGDIPIVSRGGCLNRQCDEWVTENPRAYDLLVKEVLSAAERGQAVSVRQKAERIRWGDLTGAHGTPTKLSNSLTAPLARRIIAEHPWVARYVTLRRSVCDTGGSR